MGSMRILIVDDEEVQRKALAGFLRKKGFEVTACGSFDEALSNLKNSIYDAAIIDMRLGKRSGIELLDELNRINPLTRVIIVTAYGTIDTAVTSIKEGAVDFLTKPINLEELYGILKRIEEDIDIFKKTTFHSREEISVRNIVAKSKAMREILALAYRAAKSLAPVLITGESGTGKEEIAGFIHRASERKGQFIAVSCAAIPDSLLESELFGYEKGAFTGAERTQKGKIELAEGGTLFLDEIGEMSQGLQAKLLRFLESGEYWRLGSDRPLKANVRIITATNRDLGNMIEKGDFREDLFYRINTIHIHIPPLRKRREDIIPLAEHFLKLFSKKQHKRIKGFTRQARYLLISYPFKGNVRELRNMVERAVILTDADYIDSEDLVNEDERVERVPLTLEDVEKEHIKKVLLMTDWNIKEAASILGVHRNTLSQKIKKYFKGRGDPE